MPNFAHEVVTFVVRFCRFAGFAGRPARVFGTAIAQVFSGSDPRGVRGRGRVDWETLISDRSSCSSTTLGFELEGGQPGVVARRKTQRRCKIFRHHSRESKALFLNKQLHFLPRSMSPEDVPWMPVSRNISRNCQFFLHLFPLRRILKGCSLQMAARLPELGRSVCGSGRCGARP